MAPVCGRQRGSWHRPPARGEGAARAGGAGKGLQQGAERIVTKWGQGTSRGRGTPGSAQRRHGAGRARRCQTALASTRTALPRGKPGAEQGLRGGPCPRCSAEPRAQGTALPHAPWCRGLLSALQAAAGGGQAVGKQAAAAEAWPLLLLKGTGGGRQALGGWRGAGRQWAEPGTQMGAEGAGGTGCCGAEPSLASPAGAVTTQGLTRCPRRGTCVTPATATIPGRGHGHQRRACQRPRCHHASQHRVRMGRGQRQMEPEHDGAELGTVPAGLCPAAQAGARDSAGGWEPRAAVVRDGDGDRVRDPSASPALAPWCWAGRREGREGSSKGTLVSDEGSPLAVGLVVLTVRLRGALLLPDVRGEPLVGDDPAVQGIDLHAPQAEA